MDAPTPEDVRRAVADFDARQQKIVAGMLAVMVKHPQRVREREWITQQLTELTLLAGDFEAASAAAGVSAVQGYLEGHANELLNASFLVFQRVALDLEPRASSGFTFEEALQCGLGYLAMRGDKGSDTDTQADTHDHDHEHEHEHEETGGHDITGRDLGRQPIALLMEERDLKPKHLVAASSEQLSHKMVTRAMKGRRLTANTMGKVLRAWNKATENSSRPTDLFNYEP